MEDLEDDDEPVYTKRNRQAPLHTRRRLFNSVTDGSVRRAGQSVVLNNSVDYHPEYQSPTSYFNHRPDRMSSHKDEIIRMNHLYGQKDYKS